ncbi:hypothetical protein RJ640_007651 [Escallonia rubra]|uniref:GAG-pre-integrase domain-containing protein n=1 Tax=Escallonia rubra TaxID=112253 RepID=A0AA88QHT8_9ASTE|nr:hypothetical protein RJ640_007651 [Escallonia rubra]
MSLPLLLGGGLKLLLYKHGGDGGGDGGRCNARGFLANQDVKCLSAISETSWLWHRRLGHMHMEHLKDISSKELVRGLPKIKFEKDKYGI